MRRLTPAHVPHTVTAKEANSERRSGLKLRGASRPGKPGSSMIAVICAPARPAVRIQGTRLLGSAAELARSGDKQ